MIYSYFVEKLARQSFANVQNHNYDEVLKALAPNVTHHFAGDHALGGTRHDKETLRRWFNRLGTVLPNIQFDVRNVCRGGRQSLSSGWRLQRLPMAIPTLTLASTSSQCGGVRSVRSMCLRTLRPWPRA
jgi:SnoaL-like domain